MPITPGQVFAKFRQIPEMQNLIRDCYYDDVQEAAQRFALSSEFAAVLDYAQLYEKHPSSLVLDLGGGNGMASLAWEKCGYKAILLEPDSDPIVGYGAIHPLIVQGQTRVQVCAAYGESIPFANNTFDIVYIRQVLHHIHELDKVAAEIWRVLRPGGLYIATREHVVSKPEDLSSFLAGHLIHQYTGGEGAYTANAYIHSIQQAGFRKLHVLRRWESVINYYPATSEQVHNMVTVNLARRFGWRFAHHIVRVPAIYHLFLQLIVNRDDEPGRMYSFLALK